MTEAPIIAPVRRWSCPNCDVKDTTREARPHTRYHNCKGLRGLSAPMLPEGTKAKVEAHERGDYIGAERVQRDNENRPIMNITTTRDDGVDVAVLAPVATIERG